MTGWLGDASSSFALPLLQDQTYAMQVGGQYRQGNRTRKALRAVASNTIEAPMLQPIDGRLDRPMRTPRGHNDSSAATLRPVLGERRGLPASRPALRPQLLSQVLVLAPQALVLTMHVFVARQFVFVARQFVAQPPDLPVLLLDDNVPRIPLRRGFAQNGAYTAQQVHVALVSAPRTKPLPHQADLSPGPR